jgi:hypothetical protein
MLILGKCLGFDKILGCTGCTSILKIGEGGGRTPFSVIKQLSYKYKMHPLIIMIQEHTQSAVPPTKKSYRLSQQLSPPIIETPPPDPPAPPAPPKEKKPKVPKEKKPKVPKQKKSKTQLKQKRIQKNLDDNQKKADAFKMSLQCIDANKEVNQEREAIHGDI